MKVFTPKYLYPTSLLVSLNFDVEDGWASKAVVTKRGVKRFLDVDQLHNRVMLAGVLKGENWSAQELAQYVRSFDAKVAV